MEQLQANMAGHGTCFFAHHQRSGKGQQGKTWFAEPGQNITQTVVLDPSALSLSQQFSLNVVVAIACHEWFTGYAKGETFIKWPNDLYWRDRKAGGILIENTIRGNIWQWAIAGMGININQVQFATELNQAVSLKQITGKHYEPVSLAKELCEFLEMRYQQLLAGEEKALWEYYNQHLFRRGQSTRLKKNNLVFDALIEGVDDHGHLLVQSGQGNFFRSGEVDWVI